jgi:hypothetical protein
MTFKPILCVDFDGVIHSYVSKWEGAGHIPDLPVPGAIPFLREATKHFRVMIYSSRSGDISGEGIPAMQRWLKFWANQEYKMWSDLAAETAFLDEIEWPLYKPTAFVAIDDRAITFTGEWPDMQTLLDFKPWNKK